MRPKLADDGLSAEVRGTWRRVYDVRIEVAGGRLTPGCSCGNDGVCSHSGALLLHWLRAPETFESVAPPELSTFDHQRPTHPETPAAELTRALESETLQRLRAIARRRGLRLKAKSRVDALGELASMLAQPAGIDAALSELRPDQQLALWATWLAADGAAATDTIQAVYERLGGSAQAPLDDLTERALLIGIGQPPSFNVPRAVAAALQPWPDLVASSTAPVPRSAPRSTHSVESSSGFGLDIFDVLVVLSHGLRDGLTASPPASDDTSMGARVPDGWEIDPAEAPSTVPIRGQFGQQVRLLPRSVVRPEDLAWLVQRTGWPPQAVAFGLAMLDDLELIVTGPRVQLVEERWRDFAAANLDERFSRLCRAWLGATSWSELALLAGPDGAFELRGRPVHYGNTPSLLLLHVAAFRRLVGRVLGLLTPGAWYDMPAFIRTLYRLIQHTLPERAGVWSSETLDRLNWKLAEARGHSPLDFEQPEDRARLYSAVLSALFSGPLTWLGLVDLHSDAGMLRAFRVDPRAAVLMGRPIQHSPTTAPALVIGDDGSVVVRGGAPDTSIAVQLDRVAELVHASDSGLHYQLTAERIAAAFDDGLSGPDLVAFLEAHSSKPLPPAFRAQLDRWWTNFSRVRLYDELTILELSEDVLEAEVLAATPSLRQHVIYAFSPRLLAVEPEATDAVVAELVRRGYRPRVVDGCD
jgi:hypothetical protein